MGDRSHYTDLRNYLDELVHSPPPSHSATPQGCSVCISWSPGQSGIRKRDKTWRGILLQAAGEYAAVEIIEEIVEALKDSKYIKSHVFDSEYIGILDASSGFWFTRVDRARIILSLARSTDLWSMIENRPWLFKGAGPEVISLIADKALGAPNSGAAAAEWVRVVLFAFLDAAQFNLDNKVVLSKPVLSFLLSSENKNIRIKTAGWAGKRGALMGARTDEPSKSPRAV